MATWCFLLQDDNVRGTYSLKEVRRHERHLQHSWHIPARSTLSTFLALTCQPVYGWILAAKPKANGLSMQTTLAKTLIAACGLDERRNKNARNAVAWRKGGQAGGQSAGNFAAAMQEVRVTFTMLFQNAAPMAYRAKHSMPRTVSCITRLLGCVDKCIIITVGVISDMGPSLNLISIVSCIVIGFFMML